MRLHASGDSLDEAIALFSEEYRIPDFRSSPSDASFSWGHSIRGNETMTLRSSRFLANLACESNSGDQIIVGWNQSGRSIVGSGRNSTHLLPGKPFLFARGQSLAVQHFDVVQNLVHLDYRIPQGIAAESTRALSGFSNFVMGAAISGEAERSWRSAVNSVAPLWFSAIDQNDVLLIAELTRMIAVAMLVSFSYDSAAIPIPPGGVEPDNVRRAVDFIYDNAHLPIGPSEIARSVGLQPRALQQAFRRHLETTPHAFVRRVRLGRVRAELADARPAATLISDIARHWGFVHLGRFSRAYFDQFGELPSETLHR